MTSVSLLARATGRPAWMAAIVGSKPALPTSAESTMSASTSRVRLTRPSGPVSSSGRGLGSNADSRSTAVGSSKATACGEYFRHRSAISSTFDPLAPKPAIVNSSGKLDTSSSARSPIEPVPPSNVTRFIRVLRPNSRSRTAPGR